MSDQERIARDYETRTAKRRQQADGVVVTPVEIVDFINRAVADVTREHFGIELDSPEVQVVDPFAGTGIFAARLLETCPQDQVAGIVDGLQCIEIDPEAADIAEANLREVIRSRGITPPDRRLVICADTFTLDNLPEGI